MHRGYVRLAQFEKYAATELVQRHIGRCIIIALNSDEYLKVVMVEIHQSLSIDPVGIVRRISTAVVFNDEARNIPQTRRYPPDLCHFDNNSNNINSE